MQLKDGKVEAYRAKVKVSFKLRRRQMISAPQLKRDR